MTARTQDLVNDFEHYVRLHERGHLDGDLTALLQARAALERANEQGATNSHEALAAALEHARRGFLASADSVQEACGARSSARRDDLDSVIAVLQERAEDCRSALALAEGGPRDKAVAS